LIGLFRPITIILLTAASDSKVPVATSHDVFDQKNSDQGHLTKAYGIEYNFTKG